MHGVKRSAPVMRNRFGAGDPGLGVLVTRRRDTRTARKFLRRLLKSPEHTPRVMITDKLRSYGAAKREVMASVQHRQSRYLNNWTPRPPHHLEPNHRRPAHSARGRGCGLKPARDRHSRTS